jgi:hypothetical protein
MTLRRPGSSSFRRYLPAFPRYAFFSSPTIAIRSPMSSVASISCGPFRQRVIVARVVQKQTSSAAAQGGRICWDEKLTAVLNECYVLFDTRKNSELRRIAQE